MGEVRLFTCIGKGHGAPAVPASLEAWQRMRREPWLAEMCRRVEAGDEETKHRLPVWTPHCAEFLLNHRAISDAVKPLNRLMMDFDEKGRTDAIIARMEERDGERWLGGLKVLFVEESVRRGTHVLVELPGGMTAEEAQQRVAEASGEKPDEAVKDVSRCIYMVSDDHTRYMSPDFDRIVPAAPEKPKAAVTAPTEEEKPAEAKKKPLEFRGIPYSKIIGAWWERNGGEPQEGERNVKLHKLAVSLRAICDNRREVLLEVMPRCGLSEQELTAIVDSACKEPPKGFSKMLQAIVKNLERREEADETEGTEEAKLLPPIDVEELPIGLRESLKGVPESMYWPVICSVLPIAGAYADQVEVEYCDGNRQHLGLMSIVIGDQASGKSVCKTVVDVWKRQLEEEDIVNRQIEEEWKEQRKGRKANEKAPADPKVLIRLLPVTVSCSTLLRRFKNARGHTAYSFGEELDTLRKTNGAGSWSSKYDIYRLSFDRGEWGQDYNSDQAESGVVNVAYNWTMLGTYGAMKKCFRTDNIENGLSSRVLVSEMPDTAFSKMPKFGHRTVSDDARIQQAVTRLRQNIGYISTPRLRKAIEDWVEQKRVEAAKDIDRVKDTYRKRAAVIGFRAGVIHHLLTLATPQKKRGKTPSASRGEVKATLDFAVKVAEYCLAEQIKIFGEALETQYIEAATEGQRNTVNHNVFDQLPATFNMDNLRSLKKGTCSEPALRNIIARWKRDGWIEKVKPGQWKKAKV